MFQGHCCFAVKDKVFFSLSRVITAPDVVLVTHMQTEGHRHVWCDIRKWTHECAGAQSPASANNGTWGKLLALSKSLHLYYHNLMILVKIKAISQSSCETQILKCFKASGKVSETCMGLLRWVSRSKIQYPNSLCILSVLKSSDQSVTCLRLPQCDGKPHRSTGLFLSFQCLKFKH